MKVSRALRIPCGHHIINEQEFFLLVDIIQEVQNTEFWAAVEIMLCAYTTVKAICSLEGGEGRVAIVISPSVLMGIGFVKQKKRKCFWDFFL